MDELKQLVKAALLGSTRADLPQLGKILPEELQDVLQQTQVETPEEELIQLLSLALPYYKLGAGSPKYEKKLIAAKEESQAYATQEFTDILRDMGTDSQAFLIEMWAEKCSQAGKIVLPDLLPELLTQADKNKFLLFPIQSIIGERGKWLAQQHDSWKENDMQAEEAWEIGSLSLRKAAFRTFLSESLEKAFEFLEKSWKELSAADRLYFFKEIKGQLGENHLPFLEKISTDRSKQIKKEVLLKLCHTPGHRLYDQLEAYFQAAFKTESKGLWGFKSKHILLDAIPVPDELLEALSIEKESLSKKFTDQEYACKLLLEHISPEVLTQHLEMSPKEILEHFLKNKSLLKYSESLVQSIINAENSTWGEAYFQIMDNDSLGKKHLVSYGKSVLEILSPTSLMKLFVQKKLDGLAESTIAILSRICIPWDTRFSKIALQKLKNDHMDSGIVYTLIDQMAGLAQWMSVDILPTMEWYLPPPDEKKETWRNAIAQLSQNLIYKQRIIALTP